MRPSAALTEKACRKDAARYLYDAHPSHMKRVEHLEIRLADKSGPFQADSLTEGQL